MKILSRMKFSSGFRKYFANTGWLMFGQISRTFTALFVGIYVARYLGPSNFGLLSYATSLVGLFSAIAALGLNAVVVRELVSDEKRRDELLGTTFALRCIGVLLLFGTLAVAVGLMRNDFFTNLLIFIIASAEVFRVFNVIEFYFQSRVLSKGRIPEI